MIIKSISRKSGSFRQLLDYINKGEQRKNIPIFHNLKTDPDNVKYIAQEFEENAQYSPKRKNGVMCYHEILALSGKNTAHITPEILEDLARKYLALRAPEALAYAKAHTDTQHPHIHFCISGNKIKQKAKNRLSKADFSRVKRELEKYKQRKYPELTLKKQKTKPRSPRRQRGACTKERLTTTVSEIFRTASSLPEVIRNLEKHEIQPYQRGKQEIYGVIYQKEKYRLSTLGVRRFIDDRIGQWERTKKRLCELEKIHQQKEKQRALASTLICNVPLSWVFLRVQKPNESLHPNEWLYWFV